MKRKIYIMTWDSDVDAYAEHSCFNVAKHKGLPEIIKQANRECEKVKRLGFERLAYMISDEHGDFVVREEYV